MRQIVDFNFEPGRLALLQNSRIEDSLNHKTKPHYIRPYVVVKHTIRGLYILSELNGTVSHIRATAFYVVPYCTRYSSSIPVTELINIPIDELDALTYDDPLDQDFKVMTDFVAPQDSLS